MSGTTVRILSGFCQDSVGKRSEVVGWSDTILTGRPLFAIICVRLLEPTTLEENRVKIYSRLDCSLFILHMFTRCLEASHLVNGCIPIT
jgi:hypothetical protein